MTQREIDLQSDNMSRIDSEIEEAFKVFDKDNDGKITKIEIMELVTKLGGDISNPHVQDLLNYSGRNSLNKDQFMEFWCQMEENSVENDYDSNEEIKEAFRKYDFNDDGFITKDEMAQVISKLTFVSNKESEVQKCFEELDANDDGRISYAEFLVKLKIS